MSTSIPMPAPETTINAVQARQRFGELLDKTFYQGKRFLVERAGKFMVAIVPVSEYQAMQRMKAEASARFFATTAAIQQQVSESGVSDAELQSLIDEAVTEVRAQNAQPSPESA